MSDHYICLQYLSFLSQIFRLCWLWRNRELVRDIVRRKFSKQLLPVFFLPNEVISYVYRGRRFDSCFWNSFFFSIAFFQLENPFFVKAESALGEVSIPFWSAFKQEPINIHGSCFKQVWQQAASLLSSWCKSFSFECCSLARFVDSLLVFDTSSKIPNSYPLVEETRPSKWHQRRVLIGRPNVNIFSTNMGRTSVLG